MLETIVTVTGKHILLAAGSFLLSAVVLGAGAEAALRIADARWRKESRGRLVGSLYIASENPKLLWENRPGFVEKDFAINRWGFRDTETASPRKPPETYRVAFAGDSVTLGRGVKPDELFTSLFGKSAPARDGRHIQSMNFSVGGYDAQQVTELIRTKVVSFEPDLVVYVFCLNDFDFGLEASGQLTRYFNPPRSYLWERWKRVQPGLSAREYHKAHFSKNRQAVFEAVERTQVELDEHGIPFRVLVLPAFDLSAPSFRKYALSEIHDSMGRFLTEKRIPFVDLLPTFRACAKLPPWSYAFDVWHMNPIGHRFVALSLAELLSAETAPSQVSEQTCAELMTLEPAQAAPEAVKMEDVLSSGKEVRLPIDSPLLQLEEFWPVERDPQRVYAWSRGKSVIAVSHLQPAKRYRIALLVTDSAGRDKAEVGPKDGHLVPATLNDSAFLLPDPLVADAQGHVTVELRVPTFQPSTRGSTDARQLGVALSGVTAQVVP